VYRTQFGPEPTQILHAQARGNHSATTALLLSLIFPGAGQWYNGQNLKSAFTFLVFPMLPVICIVLPLIIHALALLLLLPWIVLPIFWAAQIIDAALIAGRVNRGEQVREWDWF